MCPSAMLCVPKPNCDFKGVITDVPLNNLSPEIEALRVPYLVSFKYYLLNWTKNTIQPISDFYSNYSYFRDASIHKTHLMLQLFVVVTPTTKILGQTWMVMVEERTWTTETTTMVEEIITIIHKMEMEFNQGMETMVKLIFQKAYKFRFLFTFIVSNRTWY